MQPWDKWCAAARFPNYTAGERARGQSEPLPRRCIPHRMRRCGDLITPERRRRDRRERSEVRDQLL